MAQQHQHLPERDRPAVPGRPHRDLRARRAPRHPRRTIDYRRRRAVFTDIDLPTDTWHDLCYQAGIDPGKGTRVLQARRYLFQLLTGANLADSRHHLAFTGNTDRTYYVTRFGRLLDTTFRQVLHDHAANLLVDAGIDEPVTWSPPTGCITGLRLPGREPADIDLTALKQLLDGERVSTTVAARRLHVSIDHVRHVEHHLDRPPPALHKSSTTTARRVREQASALLTRDFFQRDYLDAGTTLRTLAARIGLPHLIVVQHARSYGIAVNNRSKKTATATDPVAKPRRPRIVLQPKPRPKVIRPPRVDPDWLREQTETLHRTNGNIGTDVGLSHEAIRRHRARLGLSNRPSGSAGHTVHTRRHPDLPADIRHAAEGKRHGWQRLRRFQQLAAHPSINAAAHALGLGLGLGLYQQNLFLQLDRLEHDIGTKLIDRTNNRYQPMQLTRRGRLLLELLDTVEVRQLLDRYAPESTSPPPQH
jgi:Bacterial regulatory helix-turn-helix protein, lysR family